MVRSRVPKRQKRSANLYPLYKSNYKYNRLPQLSNFRSIAPRLGIPFYRRIEQYVLPSNNSPYYYTLLPSTHVLVILSHLFLYWFELVHLCLVVDTVSGLSWHTHTHTDIRIESRVTSPHRRMSKNEKTMIYSVKRAPLTRNLQLENVRPEWWWSARYQRIAIKQTGK